MRPADRWAQFRGIAGTDRNVSGDAAGRRSSCCGPTTPATRSNRRRRLPTASSTSAPAPASCTPSISPTARSSGSTRRRTTGSASRRRPWRRGWSTSAISPGVRARGRGRDRQGGVDVQDRRRSEVVAGGRRRSRADRVIRHQPLRARREGRQGRCGRRRPRATSTPRPPSSTAIAYVTGCDEILRGDPDQRRQGGAQRVLRRLYRRLAADRRRAGVLRDLRQRSARRRPRRRTRSCGATSGRTRTFPFYSSAALSGTRDRARRPRQAGARPRPPDRQGSVDVHDPRPRRFLAGRSPAGACYVGSNDGKLYVLDAGHRQEPFEFEAGGPLSASPAVAAGRVVIGSQDGKLFCLGAG